MTPNDSTGDAELDQMLDDLGSGRPISIDPLTESAEQRRRREMQEFLDRKQAETAAGIFSDPVSETRDTVTATTEQPTAKVTVTPVPASAALPPSTPATMRPVAAP